MPRGALGWNQSPRALEQRTSAILGPELHRLLKDLFGALGVAAAKEDLSQPAIHVSVTGGDPTCRQEHALRVVEAAGVRVHPRSSEQRTHVVELPRRMIADDFDQVGATTTPQRFTKRHRLRGVRVLLPP